MRRASFLLFSRLSNTNVTSRNLPPHLFCRLLSRRAPPLRPFPQCRFRPIRTLASDEDNDCSGQAYLKAAGELYDSGSLDHEKTLGLALRALKILEKDGRDPVSIAKALFLLGSVSSKMKKFEDVLEFLKAGEQVLDRLRNEGCSDSGIVQLRLEILRQIVDTKLAMGLRYEALDDLRRGFELKVSIFAPESREIGDACKDLAEAYAAALEFEKALPLALKALEINEDMLGNDSTEVVSVRRLLGVIYTGMGENEEALQQTEIARRILEDMKSENDLLCADIEAANVQIALGRLDDAISTLKGVIQRAEESEVRAMVFVSMAKALLSQEKFGDSRRCLEISCGILDKKEVVFPQKVGEVFAEISMLYEAMNDFEIAMSLMKKTLAILEKLPQEQHLAGSISARLGWLLLLTGRVSQAIPFLERAIEKLKGSFGPKHFGLGFVYKHLGQAYLEMNQLKSAIEMLLRGKSIIESNFGPHHEDSIDTCQCLANAYAAIGRNSLAMEFQKHVIESWESHGPSATEELREAHRLFEQLKKKAHGSPSAVFPANSLPQLPQK